MIWGKGESKPEIVDFAGHKDDAGVAQSEQQSPILHIDLLLVDSFESDQLIGQFEGGSLEFVLLMVSSAIRHYLQLLSFRRMTMFPEKSTYLT